MPTDRSRRRFLAAAAAGSLLPFIDRTVEPAAAAARGPELLKLGVASYSMRAFALDQALDMAQQLGVKYMTFKDVHIPRTDPPDTTRALRAKIEAAGITIVGGGTITLSTDAAAIEKNFQYAKDAGFPMIYVDPEPASLDTIEKLARTYDIRVAIHNHGPENTRWPRPQDAYAAVKTRDARLGLCIDIGHTLRTGTDPVQACRECRDRLYDLHVKDLAVATDKDSQVAVGRGVIDVPALFRTLIDLHYQGLVGLEYEIKPKDPLPGMIESMAYMRGVLAAISSAHDARS